MSVNNIQPQYATHQCSSSHCRSAVNAWLRHGKGPKTGPETGERSTIHCPRSSGSTCEARRISRGPKVGRSIVSSYTHLTEPLGLIISCITTSRSLGPPQDVATRPVDEQPIEHTLDAGKLCRNLLPQRLVVSELLRSDASDYLLAIDDELVELVIRVHVELSEPLEECREVGDGAIPKHFGLSVLLTAEPIRQMVHQIGQFFHKRLFRQLDCFVEPRRDALAFLLIHFRMELLQVGRRLHAGEIPTDRKQALQ